MEATALPPTPMLDKMRAVREQSQVIGEFLEWLGGKGYILCCRTQGEEMRFPYLPARKSIEELLAEFFEVDLDVAERERRAILEWVRQHG